MKESLTSTEATKLRRSLPTQGVIFAVVGAASGVFAVARLVSIVPLWSALLITFAIWVLLVTSLTVSCGSELLDIVVGIVTIVLVMTVVVAAGVRSWQRKHPKTLPTAANKALQATPGGVPVPYRGLFSGVPELQR